MKLCCEWHFTALANSSQLWIQRPLNVQNNAAELWQMTSLKEASLGTFLLVRAEHEIGCQEPLFDLLGLIVRMANEDLKGGATER